jgi:hypothetical protein
VPATPRRLVAYRPQQPAPWPFDDLNLVGVRGRAPAKHRVERVALDRPITSARDRQDVQHDGFERHAAGAPLGACNAGRIRRRR